MSAIGMWMPKQKIGKNWMVTFVIETPEGTITREWKHRVREGCQDQIKEYRSIADRNEGWNIISSQNYQNMNRTPQVSISNQPTNQYHDNQTKKNVSKKAIFIWEVKGYEGRLHHFFPRKKEAMKFVKDHELDEAIVTKIVPTW